MLHNCYRCFATPVGSTCPLCGQRGRDKYSEIADKIVDTWMDAIATREAAKEGAASPPGDSRGPANHGQDDSGFHISIRGPDGETRTIGISCRSNTQSVWAGRWDDPEDGAKRYKVSVLIEPEEVDRHQCDASGGSEPEARRGRPTVSVGWRRGLKSGGFTWHGGPTDWDRLQR